MMWSLALLASLATLAAAVAPAPWSTDVSILVDAGQTAAMSANVVALPVLEAPGLTVEVQGTNLTWAFQLCVKLHVGSPASAGAQEFAKTGYCAPLFAFGATTKRALFGAGSAVAQASSRALARRSAAAAWSESKSVVAGHFWLTVVGASAATANTTLSLHLSGASCAAPNHYGANCEQPAQLTPGASLLVPTAAAAQTLLQLQSSAAAINASTGAVVVAIDKLSNTTGGALYARFAAPPTTSAYDAVATLGAAVGVSTLTVPSPRQGTWFFLVVNADNTTALQLNVTLTVTQCAAGTYGASCAVSAAPIGGAGVVVDLGNLTESAVAYFRFAANESLAIAAAANDAAQHGPSLYAKLGSLPTESDFDVVDCTVAACSALQRTLIVPQAAVWSGMAGAEWFVMVKSNDVGGVSVWNANACANNCTTVDQGSCDAATSTCACKDPFTSFDCSANKNALERWEWALIIGGGVLVAIGLIGCIVYFIQKQQRRKGFERV